MSELAAFSGMEIECLEVQFYKDFKITSPSLAVGLPDWESHVDWLFLMQHHGLPTRLLDWTTNVLVALYFAVKDRNTQEDGELWVIQADSLNQEAKLRGVAFAGAAPVMWLAGQPYGDRLDKHKLLKPVTTAISVEPPKLIPRVAAQAGRFTIHPAHEAAPIEDLLSSSNEHDIVRFVIPGERKLDLLFHLRSVGITHDSLFRDLDSLSQEILTKFQQVPMTDARKEPPPCAGRLDSPPAPEG